MTSAAQVAANRRNARKSTGPKSERGRWRVALNARRHGLTAKCDPVAILRHLRMILGEPAATIEGAFRTEAGRVALPLALAEARLDMVRQICAKADCYTPNKPVADTLRILSDLTAEEGETFEIRYAAGLHRERLLKHSGRLDRAELKSLARHAREAHGARKMALRAWIEFLKLQNKANLLP